MADDSNPFGEDLDAAAGKITLSTIPDAESLLRAAGAGDVLGLLQRLGFWIGDGRNPANAPKKFEPNLSGLSSGQLGDATGYWQSELSRATAILGALAGAERLQKHAIKRARDAAAATIIRDAAAANEKVPTKAILDVQVSERENVIALETQGGVLEAVSISLGAAREAIEGYCRVLSRELTRRGDMFRAGIG